MLSIETLTITYPITALYVSGAIVAFLRKQLANRSRIFLLITVLYAISTIPFFLKHG